MSEPRSIAVIDVGATNAKLVHFDPELRVLSERAFPVRRRAGPPYLHLEPEAIVEAARAGLAAFDAERPVDAIIPATHGSALALLDRAGRLALPVMSYLAEIPDDVAAAYTAVAPPFSEVFAPTNPGALTLARQLLWQESHWPADFARAETALPYAQYFAWRLSGVAASEVSALGAQTHLWAPLEGGFSSLARDRGWDRLFAPLRGAAERLGPARMTGLRGRAEVLVGVHDSNANFHRYAAAAPDPPALLSTGTWIIAFEPGVAMSALDGARDQVANVTVAGRPIASARFMGGQEYAALAGPEPPQPSLEAIAGLVGRGVMALPSFSRSGGPFPLTAGRGRVVGGAPRTAQESASLAALYTALMTAEMLAMPGASGPLVVDGPFARNDAYLATLAALLPHRPVLSSGESRGAAAGALREVPPPRLQPVTPAEIAGLESYRARWRAAIG